MTPTITNAVNEQAIQAESNALIERANGYVITNNDEYRSAMDFVVKDLKPLKKHIEAELDPSIKQANALWKGLIAKRDQYLAPVDAAIRKIDDLGRKFRAEQERIRQEEERKAQELARKEAARLEALKKKAEARGDVEKAATFEQRAQEAAILTPIIPPKVEKIEGLKIRKVWKYRVIDINAVPREYMTTNDVKIGQVVRATKGDIAIAGVQIYSEDSSL